MIPTRTTITQYRQPIVVALFILLAVVLDLAGC